MIISQVSYRTNGPLVIRVVTCLIKFERMTCDISAVQNGMCCIETF